MILELKDIKLSFTNSRNETLNILKGVNLGVEQGKITALVGGNGTGKTTLFNIISGFQSGYQGKVGFEGRKISGLPAHAIASQGIGRMFQGRQLMNDLTLMENMKIASADSSGELPFSVFFRRKAIRKAEKEKEEKAVRILKDLFGEDNKYLDMLEHKAGAFSYGEQRLIGLVRLLMRDNKLLLLDEPTSGVNPVYIETIRDIIRKMTSEKGLTVLLIEHNMHFVRDLAHTCAYLDEGVIAKQGTTEEVLNDEEVRNSYLGL